MLTPPVSEAASYCGNELFTPVFVASSPTMDKLIALPENSAFVRVGVDTKSPVWLLNVIVDARPGSKENSPVVAFRLPAAIPAAVSLPNLIVAPVSEYVTAPVVGSTFFFTKID